MKEKNQSHIDEVAPAYEHFKNERYEQAIEVFKRVLENPDYDLEILDRAKYTRNCGLCYIRVAKYNEGRKCLEDVAEMTRQLDTLLQPESIQYIGLIHFRKGEYRQAIERYSQARALIDEKRYPEQYANLLNMIGMAQAEIGNMKEALVCLLDSLRIVELSGNPISHANKYLNIGTIYLNLDNNDKAREYFQRALDIFRREDDNGGISSALCNLATLSQNSNQRDEALRNYREALQIATKVGNKINMLTILNNIGSIHLNKGDLARAQDYYERSLALSREIGNKRVLLMNLRNISKVLFQKGDYDEALKYSEESLRVAIRSDSKTLMQGCYSLNAEIYEALGEYQKSLENMKQLVIAKNEFYEEDNRRKLAEMQTKYETEKKEKEAEILRQKNAELEMKNKLIEEQKIELGRTIEELEKSEIKYSIIEKDFLKNISREFVGESEPVRNIRNLISMVAKAANTNVLIIGESGTGKEIVARQIHLNSIRNKYNFYAVNSSAIPESLFESEFFGYEKNAFTGATRDHIGWFEIANGGTLFFDEVSAMQIDRQVKLLRVLEERRITRLGSRAEIPFDVRIISASNTRLYDNVKANEFREDLYHRLSTFTISLPPLRERKDDIPLLLEHFTKMFSSLMNKPIRRIENDVFQALMSYHFPGNIRELRNIVERAIIVADSSTLRRKHFSIPDCDDDAILPLEQMEKQHIEKALRMTGYNQRRTARLLQVDRKVIARRILKYGILDQLTH